MDETWARVGFLLAVLAIAGVIVLLQRQRLRPGERALDAPDLVPGLYLFSSSTCSTCERARTRLREALGHSGFEEFSWETDSEVFIDLGIDSVPAVLVVDHGGRARLYPGDVEKALANR